MARLKDWDEGQPSKGLTRVDSFRATANHEPSVSATAKETTIIKSRSAKEPSGGRNGNADRPKKPNYEDLEKMETTYKEVANSLFKDSGDKLESGLGIFQDYNSRPGNILTSRTLDDASVFHVILDHMQKLVKHKHRLDLIRAVPAVAREFLEYLVIKHQKLLTQPKDGGDRPLDAAAIKLKPVVFLVTDLVLSDDIVTCQAKLKLRPTDVCRFELPSSVRSAFAKDPGGSGPTPSASNACLHDMVKVDELKRWNTELKETVEDVLQPREASRRRTNAGTILHSLLDEDAFATEESSINAGSFQRLIGLCSKKSLESFDVDGHCPLHKAILLYKKDRIDFGRLYAVIHSLVQKCPSSIYLLSKPFDGTGEQTPYSMLKAVEPHIRAQQHQDKVESWSQAMKLLKDTCVGDNGRDKDQKLMYLYGGLKNARNIYLDMAFPEPINKEFVADLADRVQFRFDTALEYVSLRRDLPTLQHLCPPARDFTGQERNPYQGVFDWLREKCEVEKIFKIIVEDLVPYPHTDRAIRAALKPFQVEKWDWRKLDICSETIVDAAPATRELHLQSSGNEAVLRSWACKSGLAKLDQLESITITMHPDLRETKEDCDRYFVNFKKALRRRRPDISISLEWAGESGSQRNRVGDIASSPSSNQSDQVAWLQTMEPFIGFMHDTIREMIESKGTAGLASVTIALIDNGVYSRAQDIPMLENGRSWYGERNKDIPFRDYFTGPSRHGTQMAKCIYKVCPMVKLYVARMDDSNSHVEKFTVDSAIKAIRWATEMGVDIISMSWTFHKKAAGDQSKEFDAAIQDASKKGIILLSSLNDKEMTKTGDWYPVSMHEVIRVGSATKWGEKAEASKRGAAHYLFPGKDIPLRTTADGSNNRDGELEVVSGSSLATAFAAGLAGLIIYTARALSCLEGDLSVSETDQLTKANTRDSMERIFKVLGGKPNETQAMDLFVELGSHFPRDPDREAEENGKVQLLKNFLTRLLLLQ